MAAPAPSACPGCGLALPATGATYDRKFNASPECWVAFETVIAAEFQDPALFGQVHQLTVDAYAVQHAGGSHPDKSVCVHLAGLCLVLERGMRPVDVPPKLQRLARRTTWPHLAPPAAHASRTIRDVALVAATPAHAARVREWAESVWRSWAEHHEAARTLAAEGAR